MARIVSFRGCRCRPWPAGGQAKSHGNLKGYVGPPYICRAFKRSLPLKFEANLAKVLLGFVMLEGSDDFLQRKTAVDNGLQTIGRYRPNHVLLICSAANGDPADANLIRKQCRDRHFSRKTSQDAD